MILTLLIILLLLSLAVSLYNYFTAPVFKRVEFIRRPIPLVSILIPARNEEQNINECLKALSNQEHYRLEVLAGDDNSTDNTAHIIDEYANKYSFIKKIDIPLPPDGWKGKNFAAHTLFEASSGDLVIFIDADVILDKNAVYSAVDYISNYKADVVSVFPGQQMQSFSEKLIVPLLNFFLLSLLPLLLVYKSSNVSFSAGIGQFIMFRRSAYVKTGGHSHFKDKIVEDLELIRSAKRNNLKVLTLLDQGLVSCRMYNSISDAVNGFSKNFFRGSSLPKPVFLFSITAYFTIFFLPFIMVFVKPVYLIPLALILLIRWFISVKSGQPGTSIMFHPLQIIFLYFIGLRSAFTGDKVKWKDRG